MSGSLSCGSCWRGGGDRVPVRQRGRHPRPARRCLPAGPLRRAVRGAVHVEVPGHQGRHRRLHGGEYPRMHLLFSLLVELDVQE